MVDMYVPLFGQRLAHLARWWPGSSAPRWRSAGRSASCSARRCSSRQLIDRVVVAAPLVMAVGLALCAVTQVDNARPWHSSCSWTLALTDHRHRHRRGWPHLSAWAMQMRRRRAEGGAAAAAINTVELIAGAYRRGAGRRRGQRGRRHAASPARWLSRCSPASVPSARWPPTAPAADSDSRAWRGDRSADRLDNLGAVELPALDDAEPEFTRRQIGGRVTSTRPGGSDRPVW